MYLQDKFVEVELLDQKVNAYAVQIVQFSP